MYCVKCGVKLQDGETKCPLCGTKVIIDEIQNEIYHATYSDRFPKESKHGKFVAIGLTSFIMAAIALVSMIVCLNTYGPSFWAGYVMLGLALVWISFVFPFIFNSYNPFIFVPIDFGCLLGYLLYICLKTKGHWFLSFAFPVVGLVLLFTMVSIVFATYIKKGRLFFVGGFLIAFGASMILVEFFQHITFSTPMFLWSLYCVCTFGAIGFFFLLAGIIKPLREFLERKLFI